MGVDYGQERGKVTEDEIGRESHALQAIKRALYFHLRVGLKKGK
jgi:hypothetical protein